MIKITLPCANTIFLSFFMMATVLVCSAQNTTSKNDFWNNVRFGGGIGLGFTNGGFNTSVSPSAIYQFNDQFASGISATFNYAKLGDSKRYAYGGSIITLYNPIHFLQLSAELEQLRVNQSLALQGAPNLEENFWAPAFFLGIGYTDRNFTIGIRYDLLYDDDKSIYISPWLPFVRVYF